MYFMILINVVFISFTNGCGKLAFLVIEIDRKMWETHFWSVFISETDQCTTPKQQLGDCKNIKQCPALLQLLNKRPLSASNADFLRRSQCGFEGTDPKVCCPLTNNENVQTTPKPSRGDSITVNKNPGMFLAGLTVFLRFYFCANTHFYTMLH